MSPQMKVQIQESQRFMAFIKNEPMDPPLSEKEIEEFRQFIDNALTINWPHKK